MRANSNPEALKGKEEAMSQAHQAQQPQPPATQFGRRVRGFVKRQRGFWIWTERLLLASGLVLIALYGAARIDSLLQSKLAIEKFEAASEAASGAISGVTSSAPQPPVATDPIESAEPTTSANALEAIAEIDFHHWSRQRIAAYKEAAAQQSEAPLAILEIPKIHLRAPIVNGTDDLTLNYAVGRIAGTAQPGQTGQPGNIGLAGHRDGFFRGLKDLNLGDAIELRSLQGQQAYVVDRIQIVEPSNVSVLQQRSEPSLTLVTCYPFYFVGSAPQRYVVSASLSREVADVHTPVVQAAATAPNKKGERQ
jgi:sortase A